jgi:hypothetical protein
VVQSFQVLAHLVEYRRHPLLAFGAFLVLGVLQEGLPLRKGDPVAMVRVYLLKQLVVLAVRKAKLAILRLQRCLRVPFGP